MIDSIRRPAAARRRRKLRANRARRANLILRRLRMMRATPPPAGLSHRQITATELLDLGRA